MGVSIRSITPEEMRAYLRVGELTYGFDIEDEGRIERFASVFESDRSRAAFDGDAMVGTLGTFSLDMTVPGAVLPCAGTTVVAVLPTHRRRGILRSMIDSHFQDIRDRGDPIAGLWSADSAIYGRFGYGWAAQGVDVTVEREHTSFHRLAPAPAPVRLVTEEEARRILPAVFERVRPDQPGFFRRSQTWWENRHFHDEPRQRDGATAYRYAIAESGGEATGYVQYRFKSDWTAGHGRGEVNVSEMLATDPESWAGLWSFVLNHDLTARIMAFDRSPEDPLFDLLEGPRRAQQRPSDSLWIRIADVKAALEGRAYSAPARLLLELHDPLDATVSTWNVDVGPDGADVSPGSGESHVSLDLEDLGACFMGWSRLRQLAAAGRVSGEVEAITAFDRAMAWSPQPWCPEVF